jgi:hypothetical protein
LNEVEKEERANFYHDNNIGWVARPKHNENGYVRRGRFKKASNMNFALNISNKVERILRNRIERKLRDEKTDRIDFLEEDAIYREALAEVLAGDSRASVGGNIRIGEFILIVDSDTQVVRLQALLIKAQLLTLFLAGRLSIVRCRRNVFISRGSYCPTLHRCYASLLGLL